MTEPQRPSSSSDYADAISGVLERAAEIEGAKGAAIEAKTPILARPPVVVGVTLVFAAMMFFNLRSSGREVPQLPPEAERASAQVSVMVATQALQAYRDEHGELPASLEDVGLSEELYDYDPGTDGHFELRTTIGGATVRYDSREGVESLLRSMGRPVDSIG